MMSYRHQVRIVSDVLFAVKEGHQDGVGIAQLMRKANLSYVRATKIIAELVNVGLIEEVRMEKSTRYKITPAGLEYLQVYEQFYEFAKSFGLSI
ncbi:MAG: winged helix-turn-helix domain-containing protein [Nitrososphaeria archaeon]